jgi:hypothetical protein
MGRIGGQYFTIAGFEAKENVSHSETKFHFVLTWSKWPNSGVNNILSNYVSKAVISYPNFMVRLI